MDLLEAHGQALQAFDRVVHAVGDGDWDRGTPCTEWTVRDIVNHLVNEQLWVPPLLAGSTLEDVGDRFDGDVLGADPVAAWESAAEAAREAWLGEDVLERSVHLSFGLSEAAEYGWQLSIDAAVHAWDVATALGRPGPLDEDLAGQLLDVVRPWVDGWQGSGMFAPPVPAGHDASAGSRLVALLGRTPAR